MLMMSTSGTTGSPKFVKQSYLNIKNNSEQIIKYLKIKKKILQLRHCQFHMCMVYQ